MVWISGGAPSRSSLARSRLMCVSTTLVFGSKWKSQTPSSSMVRVTTWPGRRIRYSSRRNSRGCSSIRRPARATGGGVHAPQQLGEGEGLGEVVVAARLQPLHPVADAGARGEEQRGRRHL